MRKLLLLLSFSALSYSLIAQEDSILRNFKYRVSHYRAVSFYMNGSGQLNNLDLATGSNKANYSSGNFGMNYYFAKSTERILFNFAGEISCGFGFNHFKNELDNSRAKSLALYTDFSLLNKWFAGNFFTELGADIGTNFQTGQVNGTLPESWRSKQHDLSLTIHAGIGKGRLENVTDMQNALWLARALTDEDKFSRSLSTGELDELGRALTQANNTRVLDLRKRTQFILESIDNYFQKKGLIGVSDIRYFSTLNDILFFAANNNRLSGTEKYIRLTPVVNFSGSDQTDNVVSTRSENRVSLQAATLSIGFSRYHPANLKHQNELGASVFASYISQDYTDKYFVSGTLTNIVAYGPLLKQAGAILFFRHSIYPDTRTIVSFDLHSNSGLEDINKDTYFFSNTTLSASLNYFISYRTRFIGSLGGSYQKHFYNLNPDLQQLSDGWNVYVNAGIQISL